jgi:tetratricopeptide (TPR) repeat protein
MVTTLSPSEEGQLAQTIEMFEVITQSQPLDYQSLEILKEAYSKLGREKDVVSTSKRIAQAYVQMGQLSSAILEYETILQRFPEDPDVQSALKEIESKANNFPLAANGDTGVVRKNGDTKSAVKKTNDRPVGATEIDDGRKNMHRLFVDSKMITAGDFELCWPKADAPVPASTTVEPFIGVLADKGLFDIEKALKVLSDKSRCAFLPLQQYDVDIDFARSFPAETCRKWCVLPIDRMSNSVLVATCNPFNQQAAKELATASGQRLVWYLAQPVDLLKNIRKAFR